MTDKSGNKATEALDDYLELLLTPEESTEPDQTMPEKKLPKSTALSGSKLYQFDSHPARQKNGSQHKQQDTKHDFERVERLLEDFNHRQQNPEIEQHQQQTEVKLEKTLLLRPSLLQPDLADEDIADEEITEVVITPSETTLSNDKDKQIWLPDDLKMMDAHWTEEPFQTLLFEVAGLTLALPLVKLGGIHRIEENITPLFGKPDWFLGLTPGHTGNINVVDTTRWVMPDRYQDAKEAGLDYQFIILLADTNWGLACTQVQNAISLSPDNVRWRTTTGKRPWLAGMLIDEMCALLDVDTLIYLLEENFPR